MIFILTALFSDRFRLPIHDRFTKGAEMARKAMRSLPAKLFSEIKLQISCLSRSNTVPVKNADALEEKKRCHSTE